MRRRQKKHKEKRKKGKKEVNRKRRKMRGSEKRVREEEGWGEENRGLVGCGGDKRPPPRACP